MFSFQGSRALKDIIVLLKWIICVDDCVSVVPAPSPFILLTHFISTQGFQVHADYNYVRLRLWSRLMDFLFFISTFIRIITRLNYITFACRTYVRGLGHSGLFLSFPAHLFQSHKQHCSCSSGNYNWIMIFKSQYDINAIFVTSYCEQMLCSIAI